MSDNKDYRIAYRAQRVANLLIKADISEMTEEQKTLALECIKCNAELILEHCNNPLED